MNFMVLKHLKSIKLPIRIFGSHNFERDEGLTFTLCTCGNPGV
ncbi:hypothetical protein Nmel_012641 [Mimus melanotis]